MFNQPLNDSFKYSNLKILTLPRNYNQPITYEFQKYSYNLMTIKTHNKNINLVYDNNKINIEDNLILFVN